MEITRFSSIQFIKIPRNVWTTTITRFLNDITDKLIFTLVPLFLANVLSVSTVIIGLIGGLEKPHQVYSKEYSGWLPDRIGCK